MCVACVESIHFLSLNNIPVYTTRLFICHTLMGTQAVSCLAIVNIVPNMGIQITPEIFLLILLDIVSESVPG